MAETPRMQALRGLAGSFPAANDRIAQGQQQARQLQMQQAISRGPVGKQAAQQLGAASAQQSAGIQAEAAKREQGQNIQVGQMGLAEQGRQQRAQIFGQEMAGKKYQNELQQRLFNQNREASEKMLDDRLNFQKDEMGRNRMNERQLADFAILQAKDSEKLKDLAQYSQQLHDRKMQMMKTVYDRLNEKLEQEYKKSEQDKDQELMKTLSQMKTAYQKKMAEDQADAANKAQMWGILGGMAGIAAGSVGGPMGMAAGYGAGSSIGTAFGSNL